MTTDWTLESLLELIRGFQPACIVAAAAELDLFSFLEAEPMEASALADVLHADPHGLRVLLDALAALTLITKQEQGYSVTGPVKSLLSRDTDTSILHGVQHLANCLRSWSQLAHTVKTGQMFERSPSIRGARGDTESFIGAMQIFTRHDIASNITRLADIRFTHLLDIGGASGNWTVGFLESRPDAKATLFDLPQVIPLAESHLAQCHMADRVHLVSGDYNTDTLPAGADLVWLSAITHQNSRPQNRALFTKIQTALCPGGSLVIRDIVMAPSRTTPAAGALFAVNMLACTQGGNTYTLNEYQEDLEEAGFTTIELCFQDEGMNSLIRATKA
ncbi:MAG: methyltransferase domain-containing protein [Phycisphaerae bacterium]|nr:methyltransferase domain-containing protein [Phycisphaerae bacterium]